MTEVVDRILLVPRYSSLAGAGTFYSAPILVRDYGQANFYFAKVAALGSPAALLEVVVEESPDLEIWESIGSPLTLDAPDVREFRFEWIRMRMTVGGADPGVTCWCIGEFVRRKAA